MKQFLLASLLSVGMVGVANAAPADIVTNVTDRSMSMSDKVSFKSVKNHKQTSRKSLAPGVTITTKDGIKKLNAPILQSRLSNNVKKNVQAKAEANLPEGHVLFESFEDWDGEDAFWTPDGWSVEMRGDVQRGESWTISVSAGMLPPPSDGKYYYGINFATEKQDEWLISPEVQLEEGMILSYWLYLDPMFLFNMNNVDWDTLEFIGEREVAATLQIWVQPEGGEWVMLHDYVDDYKDLSLLELMDLSPTALEKNTCSLADYAGKKVKVAFRYVGIDGNTMFIDAVGIGYPSLEDVSYMDPFSTLYWGFERGTSLTGLGAAIAQYPVYAPLTWTNMSYIEGATFSWKYCDPITAEFVTDNNPDELVVTYVPDYSSAASMKNNLFYPPELIATAPNATAGSYTSPYAYFQAGGKGERTLNDGKELNVSLFPFSFHDRGLAITTVDDESIGDSAIPVFGYNSNADRYWLNYSLNGEEPIDGIYSKLEGIANVLFPSEAPLVVNGLTVFGFGKIADDAEFTATIYALNAECSADISTFTKIASTKISGSDVMKEDANSRGYLAFPFDFEAPAVVKATEEHPAYVFMFEGFNSDKVEFFAPLQSNLPDPNYMCHGYILNHIDLGSFSQKGEYYSFKPMVYKENDDYVDPYGAFAIGIEGEYPWLTSDCEQIVITPTGEKTTVALGSYHDASKLSVEVPTGAVASISGRYNECMLTVWHNEADVIAEGDAVVKGPGVELTIPLVERAAGMSEIQDGNAVIDGIYDLNGNRLQIPATGISIVKYSDGTVRKKVTRVGK